VAAVGEKWYSTMTGHDKSPGMMSASNQIILIHSLDLVGCAPESWRNRTPFRKGPASWISGKLFLQGEYE
jgi:hypothetical protein